MSLLMDDASSVAISPPVEVEKGAQVDSEQPVFGNVEEDMASLELDQDSSSLPQDSITISTTASSTTAKAAYNKRKKEAARLRKAEAARKQAEIDALNATLTSVPIKVLPSPPKGLGIFTTSPIAANTQIFSEAPMYKPPSQHWLAIECSFAALPPAKRPRFMSLSPICTCHQTPCMETEVMRRWAGNAFKLQFEFEVGGQGKEKEIRERNCVYEVASRINHTCIGNCVQRFTKNGDIVVVATRDIGEGEELGLDYMGCCGSTKVRKEMLMERYGFVCCCGDCVEGRELDEGMVEERIEEVRRPVSRDKGVVVLNRPELEEEGTWRGVRAWCWWVEDCVGMLEEGMVETIRTSRGKEKGDSGIGAGEEDVKLLVQGTMDDLREIVMENNAYGFAEDVVRKHTEAYEEYFRKAAEKALRKS